MGKQYLFLVLVLLVSCGRNGRFGDFSTTSMIKPSVHAQRFSETYGDGKTVPLQAFIPLTDLEAFQTPTPYIGPFATGFAKMFMNLGANLGLGKVRMVMKLPLPEIPDLVTEVKIKRVFFYIEPTKKEKRKVGWLDTIVNGKGNVDFGFLDKIAVKIKPYKFDKITSWLPVNQILPFSDKSKSIFKTFDSSDSDEFDTFSDDVKELEPLILRYSREKKDRYLQKEKKGKIYLLSGDRPGEIRLFFERHPMLAGHFDSIHVLNNVIFMQLNDDPVFEQDFLTVYNENRETEEFLQDIAFEACRPETCLDVKLMDVNLLPVLKKTNGFMMDVLINPGKVPESFQLKGFIEVGGRVATPNNT